MVDATPVAAPKRRNADSEKRAIKSGESAGRIWPDKPNRARRKDVNARRTVQFGKAKAKPDGAKPLDIAIAAFGYKAHTTIPDQPKTGGIGPESACQPNQPAAKDAAVINSEQERNNQRLKARK